MRPAAIGIGAAVGGAGVSAFVGMRAMRGSGKPGDSGTSNMGKLGVASIVAPVGLYAASLLARTPALSTGLAGGSMGVMSGLMGAMFLGMANDSSMSGMSHGGGKTASKGAKDTRHESMGSAGRDTPSRTIQGSARNAASTDARASEMRDSAAGTDVSEGMEGMETPEVSAQPEQTAPTGTGGVGTSDPSDTPIGAARMPQNDIPVEVTSGSGPAMAGMPVTPGAPMPTDMPMPTNASQVASMNAVVDRALGMVIPQPASSGTVPA